jgi:hypothetical protein
VPFLDDIVAYEATLIEADRSLCERLRSVISDALPEAEGKIWHRHPVWFLDGNPVVGYHRLKSGVRVLFWSGQSFPTSGLEKSGTFMAAEYYPGSVGELNEPLLRTWLAESREIQWDYEHIMKNRGLVKLTHF